MARRYLTVTLGVSLGEGRFNSSAGGSADLSALATAADDAAALATGTLQTTLTDAVAAAQLVGAGDASAEIDAIDAATQALIAQTADVQTATTAAVDAQTGDLVIFYDDSVITDRNSLRAAIRQALQTLAGDGSLGA